MLSPKKTARDCCHELNTTKISPTVFRQKKLIEKPSPDRYNFVFTSFIAEESRGSRERSVDYAGLFPALWLVLRIFLKNSGGRRHRLPVALYKISK